MRMVLLATLFVAALPLRHAQAEPFVAGAALDQALVADVVAAAFAFMTPRTLEPIAAGQLDLWGLRGLATLDPRLAPELRDGEVRLSLLTDPEPRVLLARKLPSEGDVSAWGELTAMAIRAAWDVSQPVRRVGTNGVLEVFFDGICNHLDPYTRYATPGEANADRDLRAGVGLEFGSRRGGFVVTAVDPDGPAAVTGIRPGDILLAVGGQALTGLNESDVAELLAGPEEATVTLRLRGRNGRVRDVEIAREVQVPRTVETRWLGRLLLLRIAAFAPDTGASVARALAPAEATVPKQRRPRGIVIDLRGNRGGLLREAAAAAEALLESGGIVAVTVGRDPAANHTFHAGAEDLARGLPVVVLVDGATASAAEVMAAALADQHRAVVVGSATVGKGLVQAVLPLPNGGELLLTWSRVLAPLGWPIQGLGVLPQVCTSLGQDATDAQLGALDRGEQQMAEELAHHRGARPPIASPELLAVRATCPAAEGRDADLAAARFLIEHPDAYNTALLGPPDSPP